MGLTDLQVRKLRPKNAEFEVADGQGLYILVYPGGQKSWIFRYRFDGRRRKMKIGIYPGITLADAREKHGAAMIDLQKGIDPGKKALDMKSRRKAEPNFSDLLDEIWIKELSQKKSGLQTRKLLEKDAIPAWGKRKVTDIKRRDIVLLLDKIEDRAPVVRNRVHGALTRVFNFAAERGIIDDSPCTRVRKIDEKGRDRVLSDDEIKLFWQAMSFENAAINIYRVTKLLLKMILLTGQRPGEIASMAWDEIDGDFWTIPSERTKNGEPHRVPLCAMTLEIIEQAKAYSADSPFVFRSSFKAGRPVDRHSLSRAINRHFEEMGIESPFTPHDLRRTLRTKLAELGVSDIIAEKVLGHKLQGVLGIYNRHTYDLEKRQALVLWETRLREIVGVSENKSNVIAFSR